MTHFTRLQSAYNDLYVQLRKYIWEFSAVQAIAELEVAVYKAFPSLSELHSCYSKLYQYVRNATLQDDDLMEALTDFGELLDSTDSVYVKLTSVHEVI